MLSSRLSALLQTLSSCTDTFCDDSGASLSAGISVPLGPIMEIFPSLETLMITSLTAADMILASPLSTVAGVAVADSSGLR